MVNQEIDPRAAAHNAGMRIESLPFAEIAGQSKLFLDYIADPPALKNFYPSALASHTEIPLLIPEVLRRYQVDRDALCDILAEQNQRFGCGKKTLYSIELLRSQTTVAVLTGQQAGLFSGPLYTVYKALSAVKMAACLKARGSGAVSVFWAATEDHDFAEVSHAKIVSREVEVAKVTYRPAAYVEKSAVGSVPIDDSVRRAVSKLMANLPATEFSVQTQELLESAYVPGGTFGSSFAALISRLFARYGVVVVDPMDAGLKRLASPIYQAAIERSSEIVSAIRERSDELKDAGYHAQVTVGEDYFPLFWYDDEGRRLSLKTIDDDHVRVADTGEKFTLDDLKKAAESQPERFSPGVMLRPVVQDYLFPTACYFGGGAEIAYFAQNSEVYRVLGRPVTPILHRQSFTVIETRSAKALNNLGLTFADLFRGSDTLRASVVKHIIDPQTASLFADVEENVNTELHRLDQALSAIDPTLAAGFAKRCRKMLYHISATKIRFENVRLRKEETLERQLRSVSSNLLPHGQLQERTLNVSQFLDRYGMYFIDLIYQRIDLDDRSHRVIYL